MKSEILSLLRESMLREKAADAPAGENQPAGMPAGKEQPTGREYISGQELCSRFGGIQNGCLESDQSAEGRGL